MNIEGIMSIILGVLTILAIFISYYFYIKGKLYKKTAEAINDAETPDMVGADKKTAAVEEIYKLVPAVLKPLITKSVIEKIVQAAFDKIDNYAKKQKKEH